MVFNSLTFAVFFAIVCLGYHGLLRVPRPRAWSAAKSLLLIASYLFYAAWNPPYVALLWLSTVVDWFIAKALARTVAKKARVGLLVLSLITNLGMLSIFKYGDFFLSWFADWVAILGGSYEPLPLGFILPVGISFYTFQTLSYTIDVYRRDLKPADSFLDYALYVTFFPQLVAGPIVRASEFLPQCKHRPSVSRDQFLWGLVLLTIGVFSKVILADAICGPVVDEVYQSAPAAGFVEAWAGTFAFALQILFDFSGYSTCAIGAALCLGFALPDNFRWPYAAVGFTDFWRRWHISLSTWLRDYLYISLGGNRRGARRTYLNLFLTMLIGGFWHGAAARFIIWGALHGVYLIGERVWRHALRQRGVVTGPYGAAAGMVVTFVLVCFAWVFFRAASFEDAFLLVGSMTTFTTESLLELPPSSLGRIYTLTLLVLAAQWSFRDETMESIWGRTPWLFRSLALALMWIFLLLNPGDDRAFIYFQF